MENNTQNLFDKIPENLFTILVRKYKAVYAFSLITLYSCLKTYKTKITKSAFINALRNQGDTIVSLFDVNLDRQDDLNDEEKIDVDTDTDSINSKTNYIFRKLVKTGWIDVEKDLSSNNEYLFLPSYSIKLMKVIVELAQDSSLYIPLVHQTYSELSLEAEKEDDYMFRSLLSARKNADELELNVTLLTHSIKVFGHNLNTVFDPNEALRQHFDIFKRQVGDKIYHPMKTYDSLGLYSIPVINILKNWQHDKRIMSKLVNQAKFDTNFNKMKYGDIHDAVNKMLVETIDIFSRLNSSFNDIDKANANYTQMVQKKVNFLSNSDKTIKGKLDTIILQMARELDKLPFDYHGDYMDLETIKMANSTINLYRSGFVNSDCLTPPLRRGAKEDEEPLALEDEFFDDGDDSFMEQIETNVNRYSQDAIVEFMMNNFKDKKEITTRDIKLNSLDDFILLILATVRAQFGTMFYSIEKLDETFINDKYIVPNYRFTKRGRK